MMEPVPHIFRKCRCCGKYKNRDFNVCYYCNGFDLP